MRTRVMTAACPRVTPYRDYLAWIAAQDRAAAIAAWREALAGLEEATRLAPHDPGRALAGTRADHAGAERDAHRGADPAGAQSGSDAQHLHPGRLGDSARPPDRPRRCGVRRHGGGPAAGDCRHRDHGGAVHQHAAAAHQAAARPSRCCDLLPELQDSQSSTDGAPASGAGRDPGAQPDWASCSTPWWCSRTIRSTAPAWRPRPAVCASPTSRATMPRIIR